MNIEPPKGLVVSKVWNDEVKSTLAKGGRVLLFATANSSQSLPGRFLPVFWSPVWFPTQKPNTMGILCDPKHPALADFPTEFYSNWQWYELLDHSRSIILDDTPAEFRPIVQVIDNFARNHKLGVIFEARVGPGRLLVCGIDLPGLVEKQPAARQLLASLQRYAGSEAFQPDVGIVGRDAGQTLLAGHRRTDAATGGEGGRRGQPGPGLRGGERHRRRSGRPSGTRPGTTPAPAFPHHLVIEFAKPVVMRGLKVLPRQDMSNGRIKDYEVFVSSDGKNWGSAVKKGKFTASGEMQVIQFGRSVEAKFLKFVALSSFEKTPYASMAELEVIVAEPGKR